MSFKKSINIHFDECDPAGIVFFAHHFRLAHQVIEAFVQNQGVSWNEWFASPDYGVPLVHVEADYKAPMLAGHT